jgi:hypothetical protein
MEKGRLVEVTIDSLAVGAARRKSPMGAARDPRVGVEAAYFDFKCKISLKYIKLILEYNRRASRLY